MVVVEPIECGGGFFVLCNSVKEGIPTFGRQIRTYVCVCVYSHIHIYVYVLICLSKASSVLPSPSIEILILGETLLT